MKSLETFLRVQFSRGMKSALLQHASPGTRKGIDVDRWDFSGQIDENEIRHIADEIATRVKDDANALGGIQRYVLISVSDGDKAISRFVLRHQGHDESVTPGEEAPTPTGLLTQLMRHLETKERNISGLFQTMVDSQNQVIQRLEIQNSALMNDRRAHLELIESSQSKQHEREMDMLNQANKHERDQKLFDKLSTLAPMIVNQLAGRKVVPADDPMMAMLTAFAESLSPEQIKSVFGTLRAEQQVVLHQILNGRKQLPKGNNGA